MQMGVQVHQARDGREAVIMAQTTDFDLLVIDYDMPALDGIATYTAIKDIKGQNIPVILMVPTTIDDPTIKRAQFTHMSHFIAKPFNQSLLYDALLEALNMNGLKPGDNQTIDHVLCEDCFKGKRVLLVEDNAMNRQIAMEVLTTEGFDVILAENGKEALAQAQQHRFDLILMDLQMPVMDGLEAYMTHSDIRFD